MNMCLPHIQIKKHIHSHLLFNATSFTDYHKYVSNKRTYHKICQISNRICKEHGLSTSMPTSEAGRSYKEDMEYKRGQSWKAKLKYQIDRAIWTSVTYDEFLFEDEKKPVMKLVRESTWRSVRQELSTLSM